MVGARGPNCVPADWSCTSRPDFAQVNNFTLAPGEVYDYSASRTFAENGNYFFQVFFINALGQWEPIGERLQLHRLRRSAVSAPKASTSRSSNPDRTTCQALPH